MGLGWNWKAGRSTVLSILAVAAVSGVSAHATPFIKTTCLGENPLSTPANGKGVYFSEDCTTAYVEPPILGKTELRALAPTKNLQFCEAISEVDQIAVRTFKAIDAITGKIETMIKDYDPLEKALSELRTRAETARVKADRAKKSLDSAEVELSQLRSDLGKAANAKEDCHVGNPTAPEKCRAEDEAWTQKDRDYRSYRLTTYRDRRDAYEGALADYDELNVRVTESAKRYAEGIKQLTDLWTSLADMHRQAFDLYKQYASLNGATGQLAYFIDWPKLLGDYEKLNPNWKGKFQPIPIREGAVWGSVIPRGSQSEATIPAILSAEIPGLKRSGLSEVKGEKVGELPKSPSKVVDNQVINSLSGNIVLTLNGACPFFKNDTQPKKDVAFENLTAYLSLNTTFTYEVAARRGYLANYRLSQLMSRFEKKLKKGGFFSTKTVHEVIEDNKTDDWFTFKAYSEDSQYGYTPEQEEELKKTVKAELIDRALKQIAFFNAGGIQAPGIIAPPGSGAGAIASGLRSCPHLYCQVGSFVFGVLDSIFGSSEAVSNFKRNNDVWVKEDIQGVRMVDRSGTVTFAPESKLPGAR